MALLFIKDIWDILKDILDNNYPIIFLVLFIVLIAFIIWYSSKMYYKIKNLPCDVNTSKLDELTPICEKAKLLPCDDHFRRIEEVNDKHVNSTTEIIEIKTKLEFILGGINSIVDGLKNEKSIIINPFTQRNSPITITPLGYEAVKRLDMDGMVNKNWMSINYYVEENVQSMNPYDIQQFCMQHASVYPEKFISDYDVNNIKLDAYSTGYSLSSYMSIIAVLVRDRYFFEHDIDVSEIDKHDPRIKL